jgi:deoxycytidine triphosphate deaminase
MPVAQAVFAKLTSPVDVAYGTGGLNSKYYGDSKPKASQYFKNFEKNNEWRTFQ